MGKRLLTVLVTVVFAVMLLVPVFAEQTGAKTAAVCERIQHPC